MLLRIAFIILALANGLGLIAYVVAWVAIPEERPGQPIGPVPEPRREHPHEPNRLTAGQRFKLEPRQARRREDRRQRSGQ